MPSLAEQTVAGIALSHHAYIPVLEKYSLDFCCHGKKTLEQACSEKQLPLNEVVKELSSSVTTCQPKIPLWEMPIDQLISYIEVTHHYYIRNSIATIHGHILKVATKHRDRYPHMRIVLDLFAAIVEEMLPHMEKEEKILFPRIHQLAAGENMDPILGFGPGYLSAPIHMMKAEHDTAQQLMREIRNLTNNYTPPANACNTHRVCLAELTAFDEDLQLHIDLENNILFPKALQLVAGLHIAMKK